MPAMTPVAWASIITGKNPGKHGVFDMLWRCPDTYEFSPTNARVRMGTPFWARLNEQGVRVGLVNVPFTYPPNPLDGFALCGFGAPGRVSDVAYPQDLLGWIEDRFGRYQPVLDRDFYVEASRSEILEAERDLQEFYVRVAPELADRYHVDVLVINLMLLDHANHYMPDMAQVEDAICETDVHLGDLIRSFAPDNVMLISDHGFRRVKGGFLLHAWLRDHGYCAQVKNMPSERSAALNWILLRYLQSHWGLSGLHERLLRAIGRRLIPHLPVPLASRLWRTIEAVVPRAREHAIFSSRTDYAKTRVFPGSVTSGALYFNVQGRDPEGIVPPETGPELRAELKAGLEQIVDPATGEPFFSEFYDPEELYSGPALAQAPDLILDSYDAEHEVIMTDYHHCPMGGLSDGYFIDSEDRGVFGQHSRDGIFVFNGAALRERTDPGEAHLMDVAPTLLRLYDVPVPEDFDGRALEEVLDPAFSDQHPLLYQPGDGETEMASEQDMAQEGTEELLNRLRALGYVE
jgi:predicted AlkP superfamily phosphohydrolase/phosphomutase